MAGLGCNACQTVVVQDCIIGPQNTNIPVLGRYTHARTFLPRLKDLVEKYGEQYMTLSNYAELVLVSDLADRMVDQMDMIYNYFIHDTVYTGDEWNAAKKLFFNPSGWMDGGSGYGMVFNGDGAAVIGIGCWTDQTWDITVENVEIFDGLDLPAVTKGLTDDVYTAAIVTLIWYSPSTIMCRVGTF